MSIPSRPWKDDEAMVGYARERRHQIFFEVPLTQRWIYRTPALATLIFDLMSGEQLGDDRYSNTYRPRSPGPRPRSPRGDSYRARSPPPRRSSPPRRVSPIRRGIASADTYVPGGRSSRPRSRSPAFRRRSRSPRRDDNWRARPRSPPRRAFSPRRDEPRRDEPRRDDYRARSPPPRRDRDQYDSYTRSPRPRERSPPPRERDVSPARSRGMRSPVRSSRYEEPRSRVNSPPPRRYSPLRDTRDTRDYRRRSPSPRRDRPDPYTADTWRSRRSPSPARPTYASNDASGRDSAATSRRSSPPPIHPSRAALVEDRPAREPVSAPRSPFRERLPDRGRDYSRERERSPPRRRESPPTGPRGDRDFAPPTGPSSSSYRNGDSNFARAPPTGPSSRSYPSPAISPPAGPSSLASQPPAFPRGNNPVLAAPTRPRGGGRGGFGGYEGRGDFSGPSSRRGSWGAGPRGGGYYGGAPSGPRGSSSGPGGAAPFAPSFRGSNNSTATTYPRTMRFRDHLSDLPKEIPGGQRAPELYDKSKILKLEAEAQKLREMIDKKEDAKRQKLREWDSLEREAETAQLRVDLAEGSLRNINGEADVSDAF
ncbi:unnamed protein product [Alternaria alternata]